MKEPVLVLNSNYEPINVTNTYRAINLMLCDKATLVLNGRGYIKSVSTNFPNPSIIRLKSQIHRPRQPIHLTKKEVFRRDNFTCQYCGKTNPQLTIDHVIPRHMGGHHTWDNVVTACARCNHLKGGKTLQEANMQLLTPPKAPPSSAMYRFSRHLSENRDWRPYIENW